MSTLHCAANTVRSRHVAHVFPLPRGRSHNGRLSLRGATGTPRSQPPAQDNSFGGLTSRSLVRNRTSRHTYRSETARMSERIGWIITADVIGVAAGDLFDRGCERSSPLLPSVVRCVAGGYLGPRAQTDSSVVRAHKHAAGTVGLIKTTLKSRWLPPRLLDHRSGGRRLDGAPEV